MLLAGSAVVARREIRAGRDTIIPVLKAIDDLESEGVGRAGLDDTTAHAQDALLGPRT